MNICTFIDPTINCFQYLVKNVIKSVEVVLLNSTQDSVKQIEDYLQQKQEIQEVHIISHGASGCLKCRKIKLDAGLN